MSNEGCPTDTCLAMLFKIMNLFSYQLTVITVQGNSQITLLKEIVV